MKVLVCGGRDFNDREAVFAVLYKLHNEFPIAEIVHGAANGADSLAGEWARKTGVTETPMPANWSEGRSAGPRRNSRMLMLDPDLVVAFPGGAGTEDMVKKARRAGVRIAFAHECRSCGGSGWSV